MNDFKSKLPDFKEITSIANKLFKDLRTSVDEIIKDFKQKRTTQSHEAPTKSTRAKSEHKTHKEDEKPKAEHSEHHKAETKKHKEKSHHEQDKNKH